MKRYYHADTIEGFLATTNNEIVAELNRGAREFTSLYGAQSRAWDKELEDLRPLLNDYKGQGSIIFEYSIPRLGKRIDVILLIRGIVFILEYKAFKEDYQSADATQVFDYAIDLQNFHKESRKRHLIPILIMTDAEDRENTLTEHRTNIYYPLICNTNTLGAAIKDCLMRIPTDESASDTEWIESRYEPTPTIIEAVTHMYQTNTVRDIAQKGSDETDFFKTCDKVKEIIADASSKHHKSICFVTGVPGAGKTLVGMDIVAEYLKSEDKAIYLSGNGPLVDVLCEALARDLATKSEHEYKQKISEIENQGGKKKDQKIKIKELQKPISKKDALSQVKAMIQMVHRYRKACLENTKEENGQIVEDLDAKRSDKSNYVPVDHIAIFDEAQRAWTKRGLAKFMNEKHNWADFPMSEPEFLISCLDRHQDWGVVVCLVGGGQEINHDEAGIDEWINAINRSYPDWHVYISSQLYDKEYMAGKALEKLKAHHKYVFEADELHLSVSRRSFKAEHLASFVKAVLDVDIEKARQELCLLNEYPIYVTRDLELARTQIREWANGSSERFGLLVSSKAERLKPLGIDVRVKPNVTAYFLNNSKDIRSSLFLEEAVSEFDVQGLEMDWACLVWDADFRFNVNHWTHYQMRSSDWVNINDPVLQNYQLNAYRVLMTRARQGLIICVPNGSEIDYTRMPDFYDSTYRYLTETIGIPEMSQ